MDDLTVSSTTFQRKLGQYLEEAARRPVYITRNGRPLRVMLDVEAYEKLLNGNGDAVPAKPPLDLSRAAVMEKLLALEPELREQGVVTLSLFGSVARDEATPDSDVDILFEADPDRRIGVFGQVGIKLFLEDELGCEVDAVRRTKRECFVDERGLLEAIRIF